MKKTLILFSVLAFILSVGACAKKKESTSAEPAATPAAVPEKPAAAAPAAPAAPAKEAPAADTSGKIGVPECDEYISKVMKCVSDKVPAAAQATLKSGFEKSIDAWKQAAATPQGKAGLAIACKTSLDSAKTSLGAYGCTF